MKTHAVVSIASLLLLVVCAGQAAPERKKVPLQDMHVCVRLGDAVEDRWVFKTYDSLTDPVPSPTMLRNIENVLDHTGRNRNDPDLILAAKAVRIVGTEPARIPPPRREPDGGDPKSPHRPGGYDCQCATALFSPAKVFTGCVVGGCNGCYVCVPR